MGSEGNEFFFEAQVVEGLEQLAANEIRRFFSSYPPHHGTILQTNSGALQFSAPRLPQEVLGLRSIAVLYAGRHFDIPRPKALLGDENFRNLLGLIQNAFLLSDPDSYESFFLSAAGRDTKTLIRLRAQIGEALHLPEGQDRGDLLVRLRRAGPEIGAWDVLVRLTPRPLSTRSWRDCNFKGALNSTVAYAMAMLSEPKPGETVLNIGCGSGSLLVERFAAETSAEILGCDISPEILDCSRRNLRKAGLENRVGLLQSDGRRLSFQKQSIHTIFADLPFGHHIGSHKENQLLYPDLLEEAARVIAIGGRMVLLTHEVRLIHSLLMNSSDWQMKQVVRINLRGLHPRIFILVRKEEKP